jgi:predicted ATP-binding protein involved in virulence
MGTHGIEEDPLKNASLSLFQDNAELTNASELFHQTYITSTKEGNSRLHDKLKKIILAVLPDVSDIRAAKGPGFSWRAEVLTPYGWVWIHDLSLGYKTMVAWIVDFASKLFLLYPDAENPLAEAAVCLVDEIDLHMHPTWQRKIIGFLTETFPNTQFIVTAHSPLLVQAAGEANLVLLRREGDHVVVENDPIVVKNWSVDQILSSVYGMSPRLEETERQMEKKRELMTKSNRSLGEEQELMALEAKLEGYSIYKTAEEREAASLLDEFTQILKERKANPGHGQD